MQPGDHLDKYDDGDVDDGDGGDDGDDGDGDYKIPMTSNPGWLLWLTQVRRWQGGEWIAPLQSIASAHVICWSILQEKPACHILVIICEQTVTLSI